MPFYKNSLPGAKNRWREQLRQAMKRRALRTPCASASSGADYEGLKSRHAKVAAIDIAGLISQVEKAHVELFTIQRGIRAIEGRLWPHEHDMT